MAVNVPINFLANVDQAAKEVKKLGSAFEVVASSFVVRKILSGFGSIISEANEAEDAVNGMRSALKLSGDFSEDAAKSFELLANEIQSISKFDDDLVLSQVAVAKQFGATNKEAEKLIRAATDMAAATGKSLPEAVQLLGKSLDGTAGKLGETVPEIKKLSAESLLAAGAIEVVAARFRGAAEQDAKTFSGAIAQLTNNFNGFIGELGQVITKNDLVVSSIQKLTDILKKLKEDDAFRALAITIGGVAAAIAVGVTAAAAIAGAFAAVTAAAAALSVSVGTVVASILGLGTAGGILGFMASGSDKAATAMDALSAKIDKAKNSLELMQRIAAKNPESSATASTVKKLTLELEQLENQMERLSNTQGAAATALVTYGSATDKQTEKSKRFNEALQKQFEELEKQAKGFAGSQTEILARALKDQEALVMSAIRNRPDMEKRGYEVLKSLREKYNKDVAKLDDEQRDKDERKRKEDRAKIENEFRTQQDKLRAIIADPIKGIFSVDAFTKPLYELSEGVKNAVAVGMGFAAQLLQGKEGAKKFLGGIAELIGQIFYKIPGFGQLFEALAQGPEQTRKMVNEFMESIPDIIIAVAESGAVLLEVFFENLDEMIIRISDKLIERGPDIAMAVVRAAVIGVTVGMTKATAVFITKIAEGAVKIIEMIVGGIASAVGQFVDGASQFVGKIIEGAGQFVQKLIDSISGGSGGPLDKIGIGGSGGGIVGDIGRTIGTIGGATSPIGAIGGAVGGAIGGFVGGFSRKGGGGESQQNVILSIPIQIDRREIANVIIDLKRYGYRLEPS